MSKFAELKSLDNLDLDSIDPNSLSEEDSDLLMALVAKEAEELEKMIGMESCPTCGGEITEISAGPICLACIKQELGSKTLSNSLGRVDSLLSIYTLRLKLNGKPKHEKKTLLGVIPTCLLGLNFESEYEAVYEGVSKLSSGQRSFIAKFAQLWDLYDAVVENNKLNGVGAKDTTPESIEDTEETVSTEV